jgi:RNA polymerase sigma-70 factor (ECF subfamily)
MHTTPASLLERLRQPDQPHAWDRFVALYTPLLYHWARRMGLASAEAADLVQEVFTILVQKLPEFRYEPTRRFRGWLWTVTRNKWRELQRKRRVPVTDAAAADLADLAGDDHVDAFAETEYRQHIAGRALQLMQAEFQPTTWKACWEQVVAGRPAAEVAQELGITVNAAHLAKSRVLRRLRQELDGLLD